MKATATRIGNSSKESIHLDGEEHLKSVKIGRWNYLVVVTVTEEVDGYSLRKGAKFVGHSATLKAASKWKPFDMTIESTISYHGRPGGSMPKAEIEAFRAKYPDAVITRRRNRYVGTVTKIVKHVAFTREVFVIDRDYEA